MKLVLGKVYKFVMDNNDIHRGCVLEEDDASIKMRDLVSKKEVWLFKNRIIKVVEE